MLWLAVALGGSLGALGRYGLAQAFPVVAGHWPLATFIANLLGSMLMALGFVVIMEKALLPEYMRQLLLVGGMGAFTTFSTFSLESLFLIQGGHWGLALSYVAATMLGCIVAAYIGYTLAHALL
ncbi:MAG: chromosome condensation protein CrcB [Alteromonadaceae bacterium]|nr:MAG: chromosome condensation protein CrcB [Alteromonadaceae bacterium]